MRAAMQRHEQEYKSLMNEISLVFFIFKGEGNGIFINFC